MIAEYIEPVAALDPKVVGRVLKRLRLRQGLTQVQVADRLGLSPQGYSHYETGQIQRAALNDLPRFAVALGISVQELMDDLGLGEPPTEVPSVDVIIRSVRQTTEIPEDDKDFIIRTIERSRRIMRGEPDPGE